MARIPEQEIERLKTGGVAASGWWRGTASSSSGTART